MGGFSGLARRFLSSSAPKTTGVFVRSASTLAHQADGSEPGVSCTRDPAHHSPSARNDQMAAARSFLPENAGRAALKNSRSSATGMMYSRLSRLLRIWKYRSSSFETSASSSSGRLTIAGTAPRLLESRLLSQRHIEIEGYLVARTKVDRRQDASKRQKKMDGRLCIPSCRAHEIAEEPMEPRETDSYGDLPLREAEKWLDHWTSCSPCYKDFCQFPVTHRA